MTQNDKDKRQLSDSERYAKFRERLNSLVSETVEEERQIMKERLEHKREQVSEKFKNLPNNDEINNNIDSMMRDMGDALKDINNVMGTVDNTLYTMKDIFNRFERFNEDMMKDDSDSKKNDSSFFDWGFNRDASSLFLAPMLSIAGMMGNMLTDISSSSLSSYSSNSVDMSSSINGQMKRIQIHSEENQTDEGQKEGLVVKDTIPQCRYTITLKDKNQDIDVESMFSAPCSDINKYTRMPFNDLLKRVQ